MTSNRGVLVLAAVLMVVAMAGAIALTLGGWNTGRIVNIQDAWSVDAPGVDSIKRARLLDKTKSDLFVSSNDGIGVYNPAGKLNFSLPIVRDMSASMGDLDGDGLEEVVVAGNGQLSAYALPRSATLWHMPLTTSTGERIVTLPFRSGERPSVVAIDGHGQLSAVSARGEPLWTATFALSELRGFDAVRGGDEGLIVVADRGGGVAAFGANGRQVWSHTEPSGLRRMRTFELRRGEPSVVAIGTESGDVVLLRGPRGSRLWSQTAGQPITELRTAELDGDLSSVEIVAGGKSGGVWAYSAGGSELFSASVAAKIKEIASIDVDGSGRELLLIGTESGSLFWLASTGERLKHEARGTTITRLMGDSGDGRARVMVANEATLSAFDVSIEAPPLWASPILGGLVACVLIAAAAYALSRQKPVPLIQLGAEQMTIEAQKARRLMLREALAELEAMRARVPPESYESRQRELRAQLLDVEDSLVRLGAPQRAETLTCPHCGGSVRLGADRCEFCGTVVIT